jgi:hypothetical protein
VVPDHSGSGFSARTSGRLMSDEYITLLTQIAADVGEVKGLVTGVKETISSHVHQDELVQTKLFERLSVLETAHATAVGKGIAIKSVAAAVGGLGGALGTLAVKFWPFHQHVVK